MSAVQKMAPAQLPDQQDTKRALEKSQRKIEQQKEANKGLTLTNQTLAISLRQLQEKYQTLEKQVNTLKKYKLTLHYAAGIQCNFCTRLLTREEFSTHLPECTR